MCRLLGIVANEPTEFRIVLREAPRSIAHLSKEHRDGWGLAVFHANGSAPDVTDEGASATGWSLHKGINCASEDERFHKLAVGSRGELLVAHIRQRTVGQTSLDNTHPFAAGRWIFAHNGTIKDLDYIRARTSDARRAAIRGQTDSELFFAYLLTHLDAVGVSDADVATKLTDDAVRAATRDARARANIGAFNFILSDGATLYAHRFGRTLSILERRPDDEVIPSRRSRDGTVVHTPWSPRRHAIFIASENLTNEPWDEISDGMLLRIDREPSPRWRMLAP